MNSARKRPHCLVAPLCAIVAVAVACEGTALNFTPQNTEVVVAPEP